MDGVSLEQVYRDYYDKVKSLVWKKVGDSAAVEDLVSEIFLKIAKHIDSFDESKASISTWVYTIANHRIMDFYRTRKIYVELPQENGTEGTLPETLVIHEELDANILLEEQLEELADALAKLKVKERDVIILHYYQELTLKEIAEKMDMSYVNAKVLHKKALTNLRNMMRDNLQ